MKKMLLATAGPAITGCAQQTFTVPKQTGSSSTKGSSPSFLRFLELGRRKHRAAKICGGAKILLKRNPANIRKWIARFFYYFRHLYSAGSC